MTPAPNLSVELNCRPDDAPKTPAPRRSRTGELGVWLFLSALGKRIL